MVFNTSEQTFMWNLMNISDNNCKYNLNKIDENFMDLNDLERIELQKYPAEKPLDDISELMIRRLQFGYSLSTYQ